MTIVKWDKWTQKRYGQEMSYILGMDWLKSCKLVEDWGCSLCYAKKFRQGDYRGIDGTAGKADVVADLSTYKSDTPGLFMRAVLCHNYDWRDILQNALDSFTERMFLMIYRPLQAKQKVIIPKNPVELDLPRDELVAMVKPYLVFESRVEPSAHGHEVIFFLEKKVVAKKLVEPTPWVG